MRGFPIPQADRDRPPAPRQRPALLTDVGLNGHTIDGDNAPVAECPADEPCDVGIDNAGHANVTIKSGSVREFGLGVFLRGATDNRVLRLSASQNLDFGVVAEKRSSYLPCPLTKPQVANRTGSIRGWE
jgi:hypothetical protein